MGRQHLAVGVDAHVAVAGLLQQQLQVAQVVAADDDEGPGLDGLGHLGRLRCAVGAGVGAVQQLHHLQVDLPHLHGHRQQAVDAGRVVGDGCQANGEVGIDLGVALAQGRGVVGIGGNATQPQQDQGLQAADVFLRRPKRLQVGGVDAAAALADGGLYPR